MKRVYFIKPIGMAGPIKIGTSKVPSKRRDALAMWSPFPLEIVAEIDGDDVVEGQFHRLFLDSHERLEWFSWTPEMQAVIDAINAGTFSISSLPPYAGILNGMHSRIRNFSALDTEYITLLRDYHRGRDCAVGYYAGSMPQACAFVLIKKDATKRRIIDGLKAHLDARQDVAA